MYLPDIHLHEAASLEEASTLLERLAPDARILAGGTDLLIDLKTGRAEVKHLVSLQGIPRLRGLAEEEEGLRIGALTTLTELHSSPLLRGPWGVVREATERMAAPQIRNLATVGGNLAGAVPCADLPPVFSVLGASVLIGPSGRSLPIDELFLGPRRTVLRPGEILTSVLLPSAPAGFGAAYERFGLREGNAIAVAGVAASLTLGRDEAVEAARISLSAVAPVPKPVEAIRTLLPGRRLDQAGIEEAARAAMEAAEPISDLRGSAEFRRELVGILARRALKRARARASGGGET